MRVTVFSMALFCASSAFARPVSFVGSTMFMAQAQPFMASVSVDHTFFRRLSFGLQYQWLKRTAGEVDFAGPEFNLLLFRHNADDWQANVYLSGALGASFEARRPYLSGYGSIEADAESRQLYALASARILQTQNGVQDVQAMVRVGFSPVLAEADQLVPWVLLQYQYMPGFQNPHMISPVVRLLYQGFLLEAGVSIRGDVFFNVAAEVF
jgi:hypothetical protein